MNSVLLQSPANLSPYDLRQTLLSALGGAQDPDTLVWGDSADVAIPEAGRAPGTTTGGGKQICQLLYSGTQAEIESDLQDASLTQYQVVGFQSVEVYPVDGTDPVEYAPVVTTAIENGTLAYLQKRYSDEAQTIEIPPDVSWFPIYQGQAPWTAA